jgi:hypothetical protein
MARANFPQPDFGTMGGIHFDEALFVRLLAVFGFLALVVARDQSLSKVNGTPRRPWRGSFVVVAFHVFEPLPHKLFHVDVLFRNDAEELNRIFFFLNRVDGT